MSELKFTPVSEIPQIVERCRAAYRAGKQRDVSRRKEVLRTLLKMLQDNTDVFCRAAKDDFSKPAFEVKLMELRLIQNEVIDMLNNIDSWTAPERAAKTGALEKLDPAFIRRDPLGVVLIVGAWNYPFQLTLEGIAGAIAAGNTVVVKPSEMSPQCAVVMQQLLAKTFDPSLVAVVQGGVAETTALLEQRFDHIMYTGSARVGRIVMAAAAKHLTPVTLELGGKSPVFVGPGADIKIAARRIMWGRTANAGQICIAPDYVLVHPDLKPKLIVALKEARESFLGPNPKESPDYARLISPMHFERVKALMSGGKVVVGGETDAETRFIAPTVLDDVDLKSPLMTEEIFGPLLPLVDCDSPAKAVEFINDREKPLVAYVFDSPATAEKIISETSSGAVVVNDILVHASHSGLPFGGVGESGMGAYHGRASFDTFSHKKSVLYKMQGMDGVNQLRYPPYSEKQFSWVDWLIGHKEKRFRFF